MNFDQIYFLSQYIPKHSKYFDRFVDSFDSENTFEVNRFSICYSDLKFGWHFIKSHDDQNLKLGSYVTSNDDVLVRTYNFERYKSRDPEVAHAIAIETGMGTYYKNLIQALLLSPKITLEKIAVVTKIPVEVIRIYEKLFYNILDRREEAAFIAAQVYPETRAEEFDAKYVDKTSTDTILKRSAYNNNLEDLLMLAGFRDVLSIATAGTKNLVEESARLEMAIMNNANYLVKSGLINSRNAIGISAAKNLLAAAKHGGQEETSEVGVGLSPIGTVLMDEVLKDHQKVLTDRLEVTRKYREAELAKADTIELDTE